MKKEFLFLIFILLNFSCSNAPSKADLVKQGNKQYAAKNYRLALKSYTQAIQLDPRYAMAYANRAFLESTMGDFPNAVSDFDKAIALNFYRKYLYYAKGNTEASMKNYEEAISAFDKAIAIDPKYADAYCERGRAKYNLKDINSALNDVNKSISLNPRNLEEVISLRANLKICLNDIKGGCDDFLAAKKIKDDELLDTAIAQNCKIKIL